MSQPTRRGRDRVARRLLPVVGVGTALAAVLATGSAGVAGAAPLGGALQYYPELNSIVGILVDPATGADAAGGLALVDPAGTSQAAGAIAFGPRSVAVSEASQDSAAGAIALDGGLAGLVGLTDGELAYVPGASATGGSTAGAVAVGSTADAQAVAEHGSDAGAVAVLGDAGATALHGSSAGATALDGGTAIAAAEHSSEAQAVAVGAGSNAVAGATDGGLAVSVAVGTGAVSVSTAEAGDVSISLSGEGGTAAATGAGTATQGPAIAYNQSSGSFSVNGFTLGGAPVTP